MNQKFKFGSNEYNYLMIREKRKTLSLTVRPDLKIVLKCPDSIEQERVDKFLRKKWIWLEEQMRFFRKYKMRGSDRKFLSGEGFYYLGRQYKLIVKEGDEDEVGFTKGKILLITTRKISDNLYNRFLLERWFLERAESVFEERLMEMLKKFDYDVVPKLGIRHMKRRWGSFLSNKKIILNPRLIHASKECIDYVIVHELCHFRYKNHNRFFWKLMNEKFPDWERVKEKLELVGVK